MNFEIDFMFHFSFCFYLHFFRLMIKSHLILINYFLIIILFDSIFFLNNMKSPALYIFFFFWGKSLYIIYVRTHMHVIKYCSVNIWIRHISFSKRYILDRCTTIIMSILCSNSRGSTFSSLTNFDPHNYQIYILELSHLYLIFYPVGIHYSHSIHAMSFHVTLISYMYLFYNYYS